MLLGSVIPSCKSLGVWKFFAISFLSTHNVDAGCVRILNELYKHTVNAATGVLAEKPITSTI